MEAAERTSQVVQGRTGDQASSLRELVSSRKKEASRFEGLRSIAVVSGKGGVGKTNLSVNLALALGEMGFRTAILDADLGLANADLLFGIVPRHHLGHVIRGEWEVGEILLPISDRVSLIPGGAGVQELADLDEQQQSHLIEKLSVLEGKVDVLLVDTGAGIHKNVLSFALAADQALLLTTTEPTAIRDSYGVLKSLVMAATGKLDVSLVVNMAGSDEEAFSVADRVQMAAEQFLNLDIPYIGYVLWDRSVGDSVKLRRPFLQNDPDSAAARCVRVVARRLIRGGPEPEQPPRGRGLKAFMFRLSKRMQLRG